MTRPTSESVGDGLISSGPAEGLVGSKRADVPSVQGPLLLKGAASIGVGPACGPSEERVIDGLKLLSRGLAITLGGSPRPSQAQLHDRGLSVKFCASTRLAYNLEMEFIRCREKDERRKQQPKSQSLMADCALVEEASRYGSDSNSWGLRVARFSHSSSFSFGRTPEGEFYNHSGVMRENL